ncbi:IS3 family transposase [Pseudomonas kielensis]|uniref:IS3 family transposase n=1 Tax=Pseudomonas kielensis TaxID=2762577 RepID=UPI00223F22B7|nr:IS3 family transposase [Pseudomonas kielensis]UZM16312.1 IS3 family transposase [Pseudomonas kielensis]
MNTSPKFSPEVRDRAIRMVYEIREPHESQWAAIEAVASKIGCTAQTLSNWIRKASVPAGPATPATDARVKDLEREVRELKRANEILKLASAFFGPGGARPPFEVSWAFIDGCRDRFGVEPLCKTLQVAPSAYRRHAARHRNPELRSRRAKRDDALCIDIARIWRANQEVYGADKVWRQMHRESLPVARCTVERLMRNMGFQGVIRGKKVRTTIRDPATTSPRDLVNRQFKAERPNQLWVADFTFVSTWQGFAYVAFIIDVYSRFIVGWRVSRHMRTDFVLDALEQALHARQPMPHRLIHHSDRGSQYLSIRYGERLGEAGIEPSVGSVGDSYDNALAETINGLYKAELVHKQGPWKTVETLEWEALNWVAWFNQQRLLEPIGNIPPAEFEALYEQSQAQPRKAA